MERIIRIGTRESQLAVWQATQVKDLLAAKGFVPQLVFIKSEGDVDLKTPLYELGVQGIFTRTLDSALLNEKIDIAVHSMKDVPIRLAGGISQAAVLKRTSYKDLLVYKGGTSFLDNNQAPAVIATSSIRRKAQWLHHYPHHTIESLRGNVNTRLRKLYENEWNGAIFAAAGLERIGLRPQNSIELDWMLPAPAQGAILVVCRTDDDFCLEACSPFNDEETALCTRVERDFLRALLGGCSTPISALCQVNNGNLIFKGNILSPDGKQKRSVEKITTLSHAENLGRELAHTLLLNGGKEIADSFRSEK